MSYQSSQTKHEVEDSASPATQPANQGQSNAKSNDKGKGKGGTNKNRGKGSNSTSRDPTSTTGKAPPQGYSEGDKALLNYGLSVSGRKERILSLVKTEKFFHFVEDSWNQLVDAKPHIAERFSFSEFRHCAALQLYQRIEQVKFDAIGTKPAAPTRIPLPRNLRVFQPLWSVLANIGIVDDEDLRVQYIPDASLPKTKELEDPEDVLNLLSCTLYDWSSSWEAVQKARSDRTPYEERIGYHGNVSSNEVATDQNEMIRQIATLRNRIAHSRRAQSSGSYRIVSGTLYKIPGPPVDHVGDWDPSDEEVRQSEDHIPTPQTLQDELTALMTRAKSKKEQLIRPTLSVDYRPEAYTMADGSVQASPGAYGEWMRWDPQLWIDYQQMVEMVAQIALFSMSMPNDTTGTYAWLLPVERRENIVDVFCKMPKASIPPATWILALLLQASTLTLPQRCTWYCETDRLSNPTGLRLQYIRAAIKRAAPTEQYGTY